MFSKVSSGRESAVDAAGITTTTLPSALNGNYSWINYCSLWTEGDELVAGWVDDNRHVRIARRLWCRPWESSVDLFSATGTVFGQQATQDSHNAIAVARDKGGRYHVAGDMHAVAMKYMRSSAPGRLDSWTTGMVGTQESSMTYPEFIKAKSGTLYFWYRDGTSADGDWILNKWADSGSNGGSWSRVATVLQGSVENVSAYPQNISVDATTGRWHLLWTIRTSNVGPEYNHDIYAAYSDDEGVTWKKYSNNASYTLPITEASGEKAVTVSGGGVAGAPGTIQNGGMTASDTSGRPHSIWNITDAGSVDRYQHIYFDGSSWHNDTLLATTNASTRTAGLVIWPDNTKWMVFQTSSGGRGSKLRYLDIGAGTETVLRDIDMLHYRPAMRHSTSRGVVYLLAPYERQDAGPQGGDPADLGAQLNVPVIAVR